MDNREIAAIDRELHTVLGTILATLKDCSGKTKKIKNEVLDEQDRDARIEALEILTISAIAEKLHEPQIRTLWEKARKIFDAGKVNEDERELHQSGTVLKILQNLFDEELEIRAKIHKTSACVNDFIEAYNSKQKDDALPTRAREFEKESGIKPPFANDVAKYYSVSAVLDYPEEHRTVVIYSHPNAPMKNGTVFSSALMVMGRQIAIIRDNITGNIEVSASPGAVAVVRSGEQKVDFRGRGDVRVTNEDKIIRATYLVGVDIQKNRHEAACGTKMPLDKLVGGATLDRKEFAARQANADTLSQDPAYLIGKNRPGFAGKYQGEQKGSTEVTVG